mgnify:CR=1
KSHFYPTLPTATSASLPLLTRAEFRNDLKKNQVNCKLQLHFNFYLLHPKFTIEKVSRRGKSEMKPNNWGEVE